MAKRNAAEDGSGSEHNNEDVEMIDVDFDFLAIKEIDFHALKLLLSQLLAKDAQLVDVSGLADYLIRQESIGTVVKTDGEESDPFSLTSLVPLDDAPHNEAVKSLSDYVRSAADGSSNVSIPNERTALVVSSRLINMPPQIAFPCYRLLLEERQALAQQDEKYRFTHALVVSRVFKASEDDLETDPNAHLEADDPVATKGAKPKKQKKQKREKQAEQQVWAYHPEDDLFAQASDLTRSLACLIADRKQHCVGKHVYAFKSTGQASDVEQRESDAFGVDSMGQLILMEWSRFEKAVSEMESFLGSAA